MNNKKRKGLAGFITWCAVTAVLIAFLITLTVLANGLFNPILTTVLGGKKPIQGDDVREIYVPDYDSKAAATEAGEALNVRIEEEGAVLLLNENGALPIAKKSKVSVLGKNSVNLVLSGTGSGDSGSSGAATLFDGLEAGDIEYNPTLKRFYESGASGSGRTQTRLEDSTASSPDLSTGETPISSYGANEIGSMREYNDAAIVVISRVGGESFDLPRTQDTARGGVDGRHYLQLDKNEYDLLDMATSRFDKVIVLLNTLTPMQLDFIAEYNNTATDPRIDAVMWIGGPGKMGARAIGGLLNGDVVPSGRTTDIYARDFTLDPTWQNFGDGSQTTADGSNNSGFRSGQSEVSGYNMVAYEEGVYLGYRYYETRDYEERQKDAQSDWYKQNVIFPFGYGLSYTRFDQRIADVKGGLADGEKLEITVEVTNIGDAAGKDVVQLYVCKPYYRGGIEKSFVELVDFAKTDILATSGAAASQRIIFTVDPYDLASYDYNDANGNGFPGYELEHGDYTFYVSSDSHVAENAYDSHTVALGADRRFEKGVDGKTDVVNRYTLDNYDDIQYRLSDVYVETDGGDVVRKGMSRTNFEDTFPTAPTVDERAFMLDKKDGYDEQGKIDSYEHNNSFIAGVTERPAFGNTDGSELILRDLLKEDGTVDYDDERWAELLSRVTFGEMKDLVNTGDFKTVAVNSIKKNLTNDGDGPVGFVNFMPGAVSDIFANNATFACEIVIGATWNKDLAYQMGKSVGESGLWGDQSGNNNLPYSGWYAPAVNLHRSPFSGRNYEYYSEDPILSGKMAVGVINGARQKGVYTDLKHFALNDQETNRSNISTFCTEQAFRELYLKPFEIAVKGNSDVAHSQTAQKDGITAYRGTIGIMSSFNRIGNKWAGGDYRLLTEILRGEWGFRGLVICDYKTSNTVMNSRQMLYAGNDLILTSRADCQWNDVSSSDAKDLTVLQTATKNILYTVANSNSIQMDIIGYRTEWWIIMIIVIDCVIPVLLAVWGFFAICKFVGVGDSYKAVFVNIFLRKKVKPAPTEIERSTDNDLD